MGHTISGSHYVTWIRRAFGLLPHSVNRTLVRRLYGRPEVDTFPTHYRMNTACQLRRASGDTGLQLLRVRRYADPGYFRFARGTMAAAVAADRVLAGVSSGWGRLYLTATFRKDIAVDGGLWQTRIQRDIIRSAVAVTSRPEASQCPTVSFSSRR